MHKLIKQGKSPLKSISIGALGGLGVGALIDFILNNKKREAQNYRWWKRPLIYAALGSIPGLLRAGSNYRNSFVDTHNLDSIKGGMDSNLGILDPLTMDSAELYNKSDVFKHNVNVLLDKLKSDTNYVNSDIVESALDNKFSKTASLYKRALGWNEPNIPTDAMSYSINNNRAGMAPSTVNNMNNLFSATQNFTGAPTVSPAQIAGTLMNAGVGYATGAIIGKTIGALCGLPPKSYNTIKNMGMYAGMMNTMSNAINRY